MKRVKYIVFENAFGTEMLIILPVAMAHSDVRARGKLVSAGFVDFQDGEPMCHGRNESLRVNSRPEDTKLACLTLGLPYPATVDN